VKQPRIVDSARKHGASDETILPAFNNPILVEDLDERMTMFIGPDRAGSLYEIGWSAPMRARSWSMQ
jgi:hypothetical protein